ncbi:hypothetical protein AGMMS49992_21060 [Clostridia bacterium]|nr:hypothetical protein AGMMS49992_21060 [Clostridia bacterium]
MKRDKILLIYIYKLRKKIIKLVLRIVYNCDISLDANIDPSVFFCHKGFGIAINKNVTISSGVKIQHKVTIGILKDENDSTYIGENTFIGAGAMILGNIVVGSNCKIGAGAVVISDVPNNSTAVGVPARIIKFER